MGDFNQYFHLKLKKGKKYTIYLKPCVFFSTITSWNKLPNSHKTDKQTDKQTDRGRNSQTDRQTDRQTDTHTHTQTD